MSYYQRSAHSNPGEAQSHVSYLGLAIFTYGGGITMYHFTESSEFGKDVDV
jgi:hypothetical protein